MIYKFILFHSHTLRQISRHIHSQSLIHGHIVSKQLQRNQRIQGSWNLQYIIRNLLHLQVTLSHHGKDAAVSRLHLLHVRDNLFIQLMMRSKENDWHILIYQSNRTMLHFGSRIDLGMDITDFLQLQGTLHCHRIVYATTQVQKVVRIGKHSGNILDHRSLLQYLLHLLRNLSQFLNHLIVISIVQGTLLMTQGQGKKCKNRYLTGESLRTCHTNLRTHADLDTSIRFTGDGRTYAVHDTENQARSTSINSVESWQ